MKCGCWQKISVVLAVATCLGCSCNTTPQLMKQDVESVVFQHHQDNGSQTEAKDMDVQMQKVAKRLCQYERRDGQRTLQHEIAFDTDFFAGEYQQHQYYLIEGHEGVWADNEVNYIGIGMYEAWLGHSLDRAAAITALWKLRYLDRPSDDTTYWLAYGHGMFETYYNKLDLCTCEFRDGNGVDVVDNDRTGR